MVVSEANIIVDEDAPLALSDLKRWVSKDTYMWLEKSDQEAEVLKQELDDTAAASSANLFGDDDEDEVRVHKWSTSLLHKDGVFHDDAAEDGAVSIVYLLSSSLAGFGDIVWSSSRHISNLLANPDTCRTVLSHYFSNVESNDSNKHPLSGVSFLELGAGAGVPSWAAMGCGARVVCTDQPNADRIRCIAECVERNFRKMTKQTTTNPIYDKCQACPYGWGTKIDEVARALNNSGHERFDVIVAADCMYMPWLHTELLDSIDMLLSDRGVALMPFALHGNTDDGDVLRIIDRAKEKGFEVDELAEAQLSPPSEGMESKQGLVKTVRLTRKENYVESRAIAWR